MSGWYERKNGCGEHETDEIYRNYRRRRCGKNQKYFIILKQKDGVKVMLADEIAHELMLPGTECYQKLKDMFSDEDIWNEDGSFDRKKLAAVIFSDEKKTGCIKRNRTSGSQEIYQNCCGYRAGKWSAENSGFRGSIAD